MAVLEEAGPCDQELGVISSQHPARTKGSPRLTSQEELHCTNELVSKTAESIWRRQSWHLTNTTGSSPGHLSSGFRRLLSSNEPPRSRFLHTLAAVLIFCLLRSQHLLAVLLVAHSLLITSTWAPHIGLCAKARGHPFCCTRALSSQFL